MSHQGLATILGMWHIQPPQPGGIYEHAGRMPERIDGARIPPVQRCSGCATTWKEFTIYGRTGVPWPGHALSHTCIAWAMQKQKSLIGYCYISRYARQNTPA